MRQGFVIEALSKYHWTIVFRLLDLKYLRVEIKVERAVWEK